MSISKEQIQTLVQQLESSTNENVYDYAHEIADFVELNTEITNQEIKQLAFLVWNAAVAQDTTANTIFNNAKSKSLFGSFF